MISAPKTNRVIVVGAGPVGLVLSLKLAKNGVPVTLIEQLSRADFLSQVSRAGSNHPITLEMYDDVGLYPALERRGIKAATFQYWDRGANELVAEFDHALIASDTKFPFVLQCERIKIVEEGLALADTVDAIDIRMGARFVGFEQTADHVEATVEREDGEREVIRGAYIVSCEGGRSIVRKSCDIEYEGFTYSDRTLNLGVVYDFAQHGFSDRNYISDAAEWMNLFHWSGPPEVWRVHFATAEDASEELLLSEDYCQTAMRNFLPAGAPYQIITRRLYTIQQRVAKTFRHGRALLAGDAAHANSPIGAMGMNSGVHDAINLAEKLTSVVRGGSDDVLDRYDRQRRTVAIDHVQAQTVRNKKLMNERDPAIRRRNLDELRRQASDPKRARDFLLRASMITSVREADAIP